MMPIHRLFGLGQKFQWSRMKGTSNYIERTEKEEFEYKS